MKMWFKGFMAFSAAVRRYSGILVEIKHRAYGKHEIKFRNNQNKKWTEKQLKTILIDRAVVNLTIFVCSRNRTVNDKGKTVTWSRGTNLPLLFAVNAMLYSPLLAIVMKTQKD